MPNPIGEFAGKITSPVVCAQVGVCRSSRYDSTSQVVGSGFSSVSATAMGSMIKQVADRLDKPLVSPHRSSGSVRTGEF